MKTTKIYTNINIILVQFLEETEPSSQQIYVLVVLHHIIGKSSTVVHTRQSFHSQSISTNSTVLLRQPDTKFKPTLNHHLPGPHVVEVYRSTLLASRPFALSWQKQNQDSTHDNSPILLIPTTVSNQDPVYLNLVQILMMRYPKHLSSPSSPYQHPLFNS